MSISTHVLDAVKGVGAAGLPVRLESLTGPQPVTLADTTTGEDGRVVDLTGGADVVAGRYRLVLDAAAYLGEDAFFPEVVVVFEVGDPLRHHHVPVLLSPFAYTTYRGT